MHILYCAYICIYGDAATRCVIRFGLYKFKLYKNENKVLMLFIIEN